mmetsp:Transcript_94220/g.172697  ORF Transcript_94220/g.172697 Transcript_94220/m.172697 type:complete len:97 (-) Transcript_94220:201-491(-)
MQAPTTPAWTELSITFPTLVTEQDRFVGKSPAINLDACILRLIYEYTVFWITPDTQCIWALIRKKQGPKMPAAFAFFSPPTVQLYSQRLPGVRIQF